MSFEHVKVGGKVTRMLVGELPIRLEVTKISDKYIHCGPWKFDRVTGLEIDDEIDCLVSHLKAEQ